MERTNNVTLEAVKLACEMIFEKEFNMKLEIPVLLTGRLKKSLGRFYYSSAFHKPSKLVFNKSFFTNPAYDLATLESVLLHECVHAELCIKGMPFDDCDSTFIKECKRVGATLTRELELIKDVKYVVQCEKCGAELEVNKTVFNLDKASVIGKEKFGVCAYTREPSNSYQKYIRVSINTGFVPELTINYFVDE